MSDTLKHFGILGMKWGRRKAKTTPSKTKTKAKKVTKQFPPQTKAKVDALIKAKKAKKMKEIRKAETETAQRALAGLAYAATMQSILMYDMTHM